MWAAFAVGATLLVANEAVARAAGDLPQLLDSHGVTVWCPVPSLLAVMDHPLPHIRLINAGGEALPPELARRWAPGRRMINSYGPTETTVTATWAELSPDGPVTIGKPLPGYLTFVVDEDLRPLPAGAEGELLIGGPGVGEGYWNDPLLTKTKFVRAHFAPSERMYRSGDLVRLNGDGDLEFRGRIDLQVKIRGYRVELGEIEAVLMEDRDVAQAAVALYDEADGGQSLVAFVVPRAGRNVPVTRLKELAASKLPSYMRPQAYVPREGLPLTVSGKVDRRALERPRYLTPDERVIEPPAGTLEAALHEIWSGIFAPAAVSVTDDFFEQLAAIPCAPPLWCRRARRSRPCRHRHCRSLRRAHHPPAGRAHAIQSRNCTRRPRRSILSLRHATGSVWRHRPWPAFWCLPFPGCNGPSPIWSTPWSPPPIRRPACRACWPPPPHSW